MKTNSSKLIYLGINFITSPAPIFTQQTMLAFQQAILNNGLEFSQLNQNDDRLILIREEPSPLRITVISGNKPVGQLIILAPDLRTPRTLFIKEARAVIAAFENVWGSSNRQVIGGDSTLRELNETTSPHAFQELWEQRLGQKSNSLAIFGRPVRGGGLRFVLDPQPDDLEISQMEVKIESFIKDPKKIFVEIQSRWQYAKPQSTFNVEDKIEGINTFLLEKVHRFITGDIDNA